MKEEGREGTESEAVEEDGERKSRKEEQKNDERENLNCMEVELSYCFCKFCSDLTTRL